MTAAAARGTRRRRTVGAATSTLRRSPRTLTSNSPACGRGGRPSPRELAAAHGAAPFDDVDALIDAVDVVACCVPPEVQATIAVAAARAGRHLILEKPIAGSLAGAERSSPTSIATAGVASIIVLTFCASRPRRDDWLADHRRRRARGRGGNARWMSGKLLGGEYAADRRGDTQHGAIARHRSARLRPPRCRPRPDRRRTPARRTPSATCGT